MAVRKSPSKGSKPDKLWRDALMLAVKEKVAGSDNTALRRLANKTVEEALKGNMAAIKEIGDRLDGKAQQGIQLSGDQENPITVIERVIIPADYKDELPV